MKINWKCSIIIYLIIALAAITFFTVILPGTSTKPTTIPISQAITMSQQHEISSIEVNGDTLNITGTNGTTYVLAWHITNSCGSSSDNVTISFATFSCNNSFQDTRDGAVYTTVQIGAQCWMKKNLSYQTGAYGCGGSPPSCDNYGRLYDWTTASTACPTGWHLPTDVEFCTLASGLDGTVNCYATGLTGTDAGGKMKETGYTYWQSPNTGATNSSGFSGRGAGSSVGNPLQRASFWTSTSYSTGKWTWEMAFNSAGIYHNYYATGNYMSVRCLKN